MITAARVAVRRRILLLGSRSLHALGGTTTDNKVIFQHVGAFAVVIDDQDLIRQKQDDVALVVRSVELLFDGFELKGNVIAEGAVEPELVIATGEHVLQGTDDRKGRRLA